MNFKQWLIESKGIGLSDDVKDQIKASIDKIYQKAKEIKQKPGEEEFNVAVFQFKDPYFDKTRRVEVSVINSSHSHYHGNFNPLNGIEVNVAHVEDKDLTPKWVERILAHELVHSMDPKLSDFNTYSKMGAPTYTTSGPSYFTQSPEYDAYTGQIIYSITTAARRFKGTEREETVRKEIDNTLKYLTNPDKAALEKTYGIIGDPEYWGYYQTYMKNGSPQQKRKLYQRIYNAVIEAKRILDS